MHSAVELRADHDLTDVPAIVRGAVKLGLLESVIVLVISLVSRLLPNGALQTAHARRDRARRAGRRDAPAGPLDPATHHRGDRRRRRHRPRRGRSSSC